MGASFLSFAKNHGCVFAAAGWLLLGGPAWGDPAGRFVIPNIRPAITEGENQQLGTKFAYWDLFVGNPDSTTSPPQNYNYPNLPGRLPVDPGEPRGVDAQDNSSTLLTGATITQYGTPTAFIISNGAIYSFAETVAFRMDYTANEGEDVTNVIFQSQTGGRRFDINNIRLRYVETVDGEEVTRSLAPNFKALDDPQSGAFAERLVSAFQWNLTGLGVRNFQLLFSAPGSSMPLYEAQLDVVEGQPFVQELGYILLPRIRPLMYYGSGGAIVKNLPANAETRFHLPGSVLSLSADPELGFDHAGWLYNGEISEEDDKDVTFGESDLTVTAIFAPLSYETWRYHMFFHAHGGDIGIPNDFDNDAVSAPGLDIDADGLNNFGEFAFGGDAYEEDTALTQPQAGEHNGQLTMTYRQPASQHVAVDYTIEGSTDLKTWVPAASEVVARVLETTGYWRVTVREVPAEGQEPKPFLRVTATPQEP